MYTDQKAGITVAKQWILMIFLGASTILLGFLLKPFPSATYTQLNTIRVPEDYRTIQAAIDAAADGDLILVGPGTYNENLIITGKSVILASHFYTSGDNKYIDRTIIDGQGKTAITVYSTTDPQTRITGFTIQNGDDGILARAVLEIDNNHIINNVDGLDFEDGGGYSHDNLFENNSDDAIDFDGRTEGTIENNLIRANGDDGIEIRLHKYNGPTLNIVIRGNIISDNGEDGIQLIDYTDVSDRVFRIEGNLITHNAMVGLGLMDNGDGKEDFRAARIPEQILLFNNTFVDNPYAITGGGNLAALNNIFVNSTQIALKDVNTKSIAAYNLFWNNGLDHQNSNIDLATTLFADPLLSMDYRLQAGSPAIDVGTARFEWNGAIVLDLPPSVYVGPAPDLGRYQITAYIVYLPNVLSSGATSTFVAEADARVKESKPDSNFGDSTFLSVDDGNDPDEEIYLRFKVTGVSKTIESARLRMFATTRSSNGPAVYATSNNWFEAEITWNSRPGRTSDVIDDRDTIDVNEWVEYDVTQLITGNGTYSFVLATDNSDGVSFSSREGSSPPQLVLRLAEDPLPTSTPTISPTITSTPTSTPKPGEDPVLVGAGDIADCNNSGDEATANLLDNIPGTVFTTGDNAYPDGRAADFTECYEPTWGRHRARTRPSPGNHDYHTQGAAGYFDYFGDVAGDPSQGYYSYDLGAWHIIVLNSEIPVRPGSPQEQWLRADLAANPAECTLAYWHRPRFSSGPHGSSEAMRPLWEALYEAGADVVLNGHDHDYERFAPQDPNGQADPERGIRQFVVGTGGKSHYLIINPITNSEVWNSDTFGVLKLTLHPTSYDWEFIPEAGKTFTDAGSSSCVSGNLNSSPIIVSAPLSTTAPITNPQPPSTLLPPGTNTLNLSVQTITNTTCAYNHGSDIPYNRMTQFDQGAGTTSHRTTLKNLDPDPKVVNNIYVRCASNPDYLLKLRYRSLPEVNPSYPRTGNLWGWWDLFKQGLPYMSRIDLWLGASHATADQILELRRRNRDMLILTDINAVDSADLPDDYYLKDIYGNRLEVWPNSFRLNLTKPYVAEYQAYAAYQRILDNDLMFDGIFFDNVFTTQSWKKYDLHGNRFLVDANEDGVEDDPGVFDAAWKAGIFLELETFRNLMPHAIMLGHAMDIYEPGIGEIFNGISLGFRTADVLEGEMIFAELWEEYNAWNRIARQPRVTMMESTPPDQIAYGYDYSPWEKIPASTLEFARTYYPYVRFGLALTLMSDGYFAHEFGDTWHGNDWWYDELEFDLGYPLGSAQRIALGLPAGVNQIINGGFEEELSNHWLFRVNESEGNIAALIQDETDKALGTAAARIAVTAASGVNWDIALVQQGLFLQKGLIYDVTFWAKSDFQRMITVSAQKGGEGSDDGLWRHISLDTDWEKFVLSFTVSETANNAKLQFLFGETSGVIWIDEVSLTVRPPDVYLRKFTNGMVLLNGSPETQVITIGPGYRRLQGQQAPLYETILDDAQAAFSTNGNWRSMEYDSGELKANGPFYHCWNVTCHERNGSQGEARWELEIQAADTYTISAWWPAAPQAETWNQNVTYEVIAGEQVIASETFDQRFGGDEWHVIAKVPLSPDDINYVRMYCQGEAPCLADALHLRSHSRYNDGSPAEIVTLQPMDGIILASLQSRQVYLPLIFIK